MSDKPVFVIPGGLARDTLVSGTGLTVHSAAVGMGAVAFNTAVGEDTAGQFYQGINLTGFEHIPATGLPSFPNESYFRYYASRGVRVMRLTGDWNSFQPSLLQPLDPTYLGKWIAAVQTAEAYGIAIIADPFHNHGTRMVAGNPQILGDTIITPDVFADSWTRFVQAVGTQRNIFAWDLMGDVQNNGGVITSEVWAAAAQAAIHAIRQFDTKRQIHVSGIDGDAYNWALKNAALSTLSDLYDNLYFSTQVYLDRDNTGTHQYWDEEVAAGDLFSTIGDYDKHLGVRRLQPFFDWLKAEGVKGLVSQVNVGRYASPTSEDSSGWSTALDMVYAACKEQNVPVLYWSAGPWNNANYKDPTGRTLDRNYTGLDPEATTSTSGVSFLGAVDVPQMGVLQKYLREGDVAKGYVLSLGADVSDTGAYTIGLAIYGRIPHPFLIKLLDNDAGGSFENGFILEIPAGVGYYTEVSYIPPKTQEAVIISTVNNGDYPIPEGLIISGLLDLSTTYGVKPICVVWPRQLIASYTGAALTLLKSDGVTTKDFPFQALGSGIKRTDITSWDTGAPTIKFLHDQTGNAADIGPIVSMDNKWGGGDIATPTQISDYPALSFDDVTKIPYAQFGNASGTASSRMDLPLQINGMGELTLFIAARPRAPFRPVVDHVLQWKGTNQFTVIDSDGNWDMTSESPAAAPLGIKNKELYLYTIRISNGVRYTYLNNTLIASTPTSSPTIDLSDSSVCNIGWDKTTQTYTELDFFGLVAIKEPLADKAFAAWRRSLMADLGIVAEASFPAALTADMIGYAGGSLSDVLSKVQSQGTMPTTYEMMIDRTLTPPVVTVTVEGPVSRPFTIVLDDGAGGWFSEGSAIRISATNTNTIVSRTYNPSPAIGAVYLRAKNTGGLTDPDPLRIYFDIDLFGANAVTPLCVLWPRRLISNYTGHAYQLLSSDGKRNTEINFSADGSVSASVVAAFDANPTVEFYHDQMKNSPAGPVDATNTWSLDGSSVPSSSADYPTLSFDSTLNLPVVTFDGDRRLSAPVVINGQSRVTVLVAVKTVGTWTDIDNVIGWNNTNKVQVLQGDSRQMSYTNKSTAAVTTVSSGYKPTDGFALYSFEYAVGALTTRDDFVTAATSEVFGSGSALNTSSSDVMDIGWYRWYRSKTKMSFVGAVVLSGVVTPDALKNIYSTLMVDMGIDTSAIFPFRSLTEYTADEIQYQDSTVAKKLDTLGSMESLLVGLIKVRVNFFATYTVQSDEIIGAFVADQTLNYTSNFGGSVGTVGTPPSATYTFTLRRNDVPIGSIVIDPSGSVTFLSVDAGAGSLLKGDVVTVHGASISDSVMANFICNLVFTPSFN